jgi:hypothetical protein
MSLKIFPYKLGSVSAKRLAKTLGVLRVSPSYNARRKDVIVNWGNSNPPHFRWMEQDLNKPDAILRACNKVHTFSFLSMNDFKDLPVWSTDRHEIYNLWESYPSHKVYCRTSVTGHSGSGIVIASNSYDLVNAPLYTIETKHKHEYRVHVFKGKVLYVQQKKKQLNSTINRTGIRNHGNGWVYCTPTDTPSELLLSSCVRAVQLLGLDFGAVDVGYRIRDNRIFVFEVNTAPGLVGTTLELYAQAINNYYRSL